MRCDDPGLRASVALVVLVVGGCKGDDPAEPLEPVEALPPEVVATGGSWGAAPWDPVTVSTAAPGAPEIEALVLDASDTPVAIEPLIALDDEYAWRALGDGLEAPARYRLVAAAEGHTDVELDSWDTVPYGREQGFDAATVVSVVWQVNVDAQVRYPAGLDAMLTPLYDDQDFLLQVLSVEDGVALFRIVGRYQAGPRCEMLRASGALSPTGELSWAEEALEIADAEGFMIAVRDVWLHLGWLGDGSRAGGAEGGIRIDAEATSLALWPDDPPDRLCGEIGAVGIWCKPCDDVPSGSCVELRFHGGTMDPSQVVLDDVLPACGVDLQEAGDQLACDVEFPECTCSTARSGGLPPLLALVLALFRRRRASR